jgi:hypothetical protein
VVLAIWEVQVEGLLSEVKLRQKHDTLPKSKKGLGA